MKIAVCKEIGFCFGVERAIKLTDEALAGNDSVCILGDLIHNRQVCETMAKKGLKKISSIDQGRGVLMVRAHGLPPERFEEVKKRGMKIVDATCTIVKAVQKAVRELERGGYQVVIIGDREHAEVKGILGCLEGEGIVLSPDDDISEVRFPRRVGVVFQTTEALERCFRIINELVRRSREVRVINTICHAITERQLEVEDLAGKVDTMIVIGDRNSANTVQLRIISENAGATTVQIEDAGELGSGSLKGAKVVGICAGTSTPMAIVEAVRDRLEEAPKRSKNLKKRENSRKCK